jgi:phosphate-selective porin OprO and OprP
MKWISTASLLLALGLGWTTNRAAAQVGSTAQSFDALSARLEQQDQQIRQLQAQVSGMQQPGVNATPVAFAPSGGTAAAPAPAAPACTEVGSDMSIKARFWNGAGVMFETPNKDFTMHLGAWFQWDNVWWNESAGMNTVSAKNTVQGVASGGIANASTVSGGNGNLQDGDYWRRVRLVMEGTFWETCEYRLNYAPENNSFNTTGIDEFWVGINKIPLIGTVRVGHVKNAVGLEGDMTSSSRCMTFMERSSYSEVIEENQNFVTGIWFGNTYLDERGTWSFDVARPDNANSGDFFGTGQYVVQGRVTGLPLYEDEGRHLLHLGISAGFRNGTNSAPGALDTVDLRARPELRDDNPAGSGPPPVQPAGVTGVANTYLPDTNSVRMIDTGTINCNQNYLLGLEMLYIRGPFSLQGEYGWNFLSNAQKTNPAVGPVTNYVFNGGYLQAAYTLTGENRAYDRKSGGLSRYYFGGQGPYENAFLVRDQDGGFCCGHGAIEVACRYSYVDLNAGSVAAGTFVNGGIMQGVSTGVNWYLNSNLTVNTEWVYDFRYDVPGNGANPGTTTVVGDVMGFGTRVQLSF